jgi:hypothetical protein
MSRWQRRVAQQRMAAFGVTRPVPMPPLSQHLREFASRRDAWLILARNLIPVVGVYAFHWSAALAVFNYWFDGISALAALVAAMIPRAMRETGSKESHARDTLEGTMLKGLLTWIFLLGIMGLPYWIALMALHDELFDGELWLLILHSPGLWLTFAALAFGHFWKAFHSGYDTLPENDLKQRVRWDFYLLFLRAIAMFMMTAHGLAFVLVPLMALLLSYFEIWPERVLGAFFGDPKRLYEYDPDKGSSS